MSIEKYNIYLNEQQQDKLNLLAATTGRSQEEILNNAAYSYLLIADPLADETEPPAGQHEILFYITDEEAQQIMSANGLQDYDDIDDHARRLLLADLQRQFK